ncbi:DUF6519 domain-containing protein [Streptomyces sp. AHU1]|uniref:DUF6519 domain-containing protein n=1 Tax=Streptomyces sp. AHU1 TaxID=3377215 RepID=UPI003877D8F9
MHADFSRVTFRPGKHYSAVLAQQGRVQLDADANEQTAIALHRERTAVTDLVGRHGGPAAAPGFLIGYKPGDRVPDDLTIGGGRYYVDGILLDATRPAPGVPAETDDGDQDDGEDATVWGYWTQPDGYRDPERATDRLPDKFPYLVCLKVWERAVTAVEDPEIREVALGAAMPDTAARRKVVWQVLPVPGAELGLTARSKATPADVREAFDRWVAGRGAPAAWLAARAERPSRADEEPCPTHPEARYRGPENQLYRVEVHRGGTADRATFKWSRENGSVTLPVASLDGAWVTLATLGSDDKLDIDAGDWVEVADAAHESRDERAPLLRVEEVDLPGRRVRLSAEPAPGTGRRADRHPFLRRWDHRGSTGRGAPRLVEGALALKDREGTWIDLEDGVQVLFRAGGAYRPGDHWIVPARTATGSVEWPRDTARRPLLQPPAGIETHYAPLAWVRGKAAGGVTDLRQVFAPLAVPVESTT